jgi:hypothetical protein
LIALWYLKQENGRAHPLQRQPGELLHCRGRQLAGAPVVVLNEAQLFPALLKASVRRQETSGFLDPNVPPKGAWNSKIEI